MKAFLKTKEDEIWEGLYLRIPFLLKKNKWAWQSFGAIFGFGGGIFSLLAAIITQLAAWFFYSANTLLFLKRLSVICFALLGPLMMLGAHFLDLIEKKHFDG